MEGEEGVTAILTSRGQKGKLRNQRSKPGETEVSTKKLRAGG